MDQEQLNRKKMLEEIFPIDTKSREIIDKRIKKYISDRILLINYLSDIGTNCRIYELISCELINDIYHFISRLSHDLIMYEKEIINNANHYGFHNAPQLESFIDYIKSLVKDYPYKCDCCNI